MSLHYDGVGDSNKTDDTTVGAEESALIKNSEKDTSLKDVFRGFTKLPCVVVQPIDVTPYLRPKETTALEPASKRKGILKKSIYLDQFTMRCAVNIFRDDLGKLKDAVSKRSQLNTSTNMDKLKCKICKKVYSSEKRLQNHQDNKHMIVYKANSGKPQKRVSFSDHIVIHELKEYHKCRKCPKIFEGYKTLKTHMKKQHKKRKCYVCNYCSKRFVDRMFFKVHIKLHCDVCGLLLSNKSEYLDHRRNVCRVLKTYKCKTCQDIFYKIMDVKDHSYSHMNSIVVCDICKDQCRTLCSLAHHISYLHSEKRPTCLYTMRNLGSERLYLCNFCEESSVERDVIEKHTALLPDLNNRVMTGYKDYYFCDHCFLKFDTEPDMVQHKWTHFLISSDNSQLRKNDNEPKEQVIKTFKADEEIPAYMKPNVVLKKLQITEEVLTATNPSTEVNNMDVVTNPSINLNNLDVVTNSSNEPKNLDVLTNPCIDPKNLDILTNSSTDPKNLDTVTNASIDPKNLDVVTSPSEDVNILGIVNGNLKKPIVDPKSRKTIISKHHCQTCGKYFSTNYCLTRHIATQHGDLENLQCNVCEEVFVWPSLLRSHKCIRTYIPEQTFDDARPEIQFENGPFDRTYTNGFSEISNGFEELAINYDDDYNMNDVDFEIPAPIVELHESNAVYVPNATSVSKNGNIPSTLSQLLIDGTVPNSSLKITLQEVPIEF